MAEDTEKRAGQGTPGASRKVSARRRRVPTLRDEIKAIRGPDGSLAYRGASVFERGDRSGRLVARVTLPDGGHREVYGKDAGEIVRRVRELALGGTLEHHQENGDQTLGAWIERWLAGLEGSKKPSTVAMYRRYLTKHVPAELRRKPLAKVTKDDLQALYRAKRTAGLGIGACSTSTP